MEIQNKIGEQVFDKLRSKFRQITLGDDEGNSTQDPQTAVFFNFNYVDNQGHDHGNITVSLIDRTMKVYYSKNISSDLSGSELTEWYEFLQDMRKTAMSNLYGFDTHDITKSNLDIADIQSTVNRNSMQEGKMYGSTKSSYQDQGPAKIIVRHSQNIDPEIRGSRSRKVESVFVETFEGERFKMPFNNLPGTRAMAQHIGQGGRPYDDIGESISTMVSEIASLRPFVSRNRNAIYEDETTMQMVEAAKEYYAETRKTLGKLKGKRGYKAYAESFEVTEQQEILEDEMSEMKERFTKKRFSDKMENAMPVVRKAFNRKNLKPKTPSMKPITEFEEWADEITEMPTKATPAQQQRKNQRRTDARLGHKKRMRDALGKDKKVEEAEELCSTECCGKPISQCHCGPECPHCDCHEKNKAVKEGQKEDDREWAGHVSRHGPNALDKTQYWATKHARKSMGKDGNVNGRDENGNIPVATKYRKGNQSFKEDARTGGAKKAYDMGFDDARNSRPKKAAHTSFGPYATDYYKGYEIGRSHLDHEAWQEKTAAKRQGRHYHEGAVNEVKAGPLRDHPWIGRSVVVRGQDDYGKSDHNGKTGTVKRVEREHTFSQMHPWKTIVGIEFDDGTSTYYRKEQIKPVKNAVTEGTWAIPDTPDKQERLVELLSSPVPFGPNGQNASSAIYDLIGDDDLFDELANAADEFGPEADARMTILSHMESTIKQDTGEWSPGSDSPGELIQAFVDLYDPNSGSGGMFEESMNEDSQLTDNITNQLLNRLDARFPDLISKHGTEYIYNLVRDEVSWLTDDWPEGEGFGSSDSFGAWKNVLSQLGVELDGHGQIVKQTANNWESIEEDEFSEARASRDRKYRGDVVLPKATYSDYLEVYKSAAIGGTDEEDDAKRMVAALKKDGKEADHNAAKGALKRMAEQAATTGLHVNEGLAQLTRLKRDAGIIK